jgi:hypothetical protein
MKHNVMLIVASLLSFPVHDVSPHERYSARKAGDARGRGLNSRFSAHPGHLAIRNAGARRTTVGVYHHARRGAPCAGHAVDPCHGSGRCFSRRHRQVQPSLLVCLDASRAGRDWDFLPDPLSARTVEPAAGPAPVVQQKSNTRKGASSRRRSSVWIGFCRRPPRSPNLTRTRHQKMA